MKNNSEDKSRVQFNLARDKKIALKKYAEELTKDFEIYQKEMLWKYLEIEEVRV